MRWNEDFILDALLRQFCGNAPGGCLTGRVTVQAQKNLTDIRIVLQALKQHPV